jgi:hypothetical protein
MLHLSTFTRYAHIADALYHDYDALATLNS